ncbi:MAG: Zn-ribbon domain-containing OB-fold protein [Candidatus Baldrarchaeia archaeon]
MFTMNIREWERAYREQARNLATKFFENLKNEKILGVRCKHCGKIYIPPFSVCSCGSKDLEEVFVSGEGYIETFTICFERMEGYPEPPFILALIRLDNSEVVFPHIVIGVDLSDINSAIRIVRVGARVRAVFKKERKGSLLDIEGFRLIE